MVFPKRTPRPGNKKSQMTLTMLPFIHIPISLCSIDKRPLTQRQRLTRFRAADLPVRLDHVTLWIDPHARHGIIEAHVLLPDATTVFDGLDALAQVVRLHDAVFDGCLRDEEDGGGGDHGREHGSCHDGLDGGDGRVGVALFESISKTLGEQERVGRGL